MRYVVLLLSVSVVLVGCQGDVEKREADDHASCLKIVSERNDTRPNAYQECRNNLMEYHRQKAIAASGR
ncbi:hypothetical protein [Bradyrhizobium sp. BR 10289]|uniref:hypothetical protein n=1 Tax=Bradyrhizobium sp. BR 10289 TaxID=2749993 RepID=UPI001C64FDF7|nr:hypothetical protein [Bradyrhizobium sp. BR 10289]MBW7970936.1 hypothetical protein [Bradyrhizobium sp. BR 10289]